MLAQYRGFADVQMGIGMVVWGWQRDYWRHRGNQQRRFAHYRRRNGFGLQVAIAIALRWGLNPNDLKRSLRRLSLSPWSHWPLRRLSRAELPFRRPA
jgi:hypothetical protein